MEASSSTVRIDRIGVFALSPNARRPSNWRNQLTPPHPLSLCDVTGQGAQEGDYENAFSESSNKADDTWNPTNGDKKNTLRGDSGLFIDGGRQSGNVSISGGLSRAEGVAGGDVVIGSGGSGNLDTWNGASGRVSVFTSNGGQAGDSGDVTVNTGNATAGSTGDVSLYSGVSETVGNSGTISLIVGESVEGQAGDMNMRIESSKGTGFDGGSLRLASGQAEGKGGNGGSVFVSSGDAAASAESAGGDIQIAAGDSLTTKDVSNAHGGQVIIQVRS